MAQGTMTETQFVREMALDIDEFERNIQRLLSDGEHYQRQQRQIVVGSEQRPERQVRFALGPMQTRRIAMVSIPYCQVQFDFQGFDAEAQAHFMQRFRLHFHKGGG